MTNEEYQRLFPWDEYQHRLSRDGQNHLHTFGNGKNSLTIGQFKIGEWAFELSPRTCNSSATYYNQQSGISLTLEYPCSVRQPYTGVPTLIPALWGASTKESGPIRSRSTPMEALDAMKDGLREAVDEGARAQKSLDVLLYMLGEKR